MPTAVELDRLVAVGLSHRTAPVEVRERLALDEAAQRGLLGRLREAACDEVFVVSTCNRTELYTVPRSADGLRDALGWFRGPAGERLDTYLYWLKGREAVQHLFRVASSLDSLVLGEPQILGQVKDAIRVAGEEGALGPLLEPLAQRALAVARRVRAETEIGRNTVGIGNAGVDLATEILGDLRGRRALLLGAGEMGRQVAGALLHAGVSDLRVANRTFASAVEVAAANGGSAVAWEQLPSHLAQADVVVVATGAPSAVITAEMARRAVRERRYQPICLIDLAVPRNVDPAVSEVDEAWAFDIDDLHRVVERGRAARASAAEDAGRLVEEETVRFVAGLLAVDVTEELRALGTWAEEMREAEIARSKKLLDGLSDEQKAAIGALTRALVKRLTAGPLAALREAGRAGDRERIDQVKRTWKP
jgi:glutamyl-tRNA reductase